MNTTYEWEEEIYRKYVPVPGKRYWHYKNKYGTYFQSFLGPKHWSSYECLGLWAMTLKGRWLQVNP